MYFTILFSKAYSSSEGLVLGIFLAFEPALDVFEVVGLDVDLHEVDGVGDLHGHGVEGGAVRLRILDEVGQVVGESSGIFFSKGGRKLRVQGHLLITYDVSFLVVCHQ